VHEWHEIKATHNRFPLLAFFAPSQFAFEEHPLARLEFTGCFCLLAPDFDRDVEIMCLPITALLTDHNGEGGTGAMLLT